MDDQSPMDVTLADGAAERSTAPTIDGSAAPDPAATMAGSASHANAATVILPGEAYAMGPEIARGGMGCVLQAEDRKLGRVVAMKVMRLRSADSESSRARFVREATVLARLEHPNIVPIHELGWDAENRLYYTMKLVQGRTLQAILNGLKHRDADFVAHYTLDRLLTVFRKICDAMSLAHARGVIHRDLKPDNVMVGEFGEVLVMDWGLAKVQADAQQAAEEAAMKAEATQPGSAERFRQLADSELRRTVDLTLDGAVMGTPFYMSPEQAEGRGADVDQQSDIFSLGGILYALLTLHPPVDGKTADEILSRIKRGEFLPPTAYNVTTKSGGKPKPFAGEAADPTKFQPLPHCPHGKVPSALSAVTMRALAVDKSKRYKTVADFAADIEAYQGGFATRAQEAGLFTQLRLLVQRHKREFGVAFAAWFIITALVAWFVINLRASERETRRQAELARQNEQKAVAEATRAMAAEQSAKASEAEAVHEKEFARQSLAKSALSLAEAARREGNGPEMQAALGDVPEDLRDSTWNYLLEQSDTSIARIRGSANSVIEGVAAHPRRPGVFAVSETNKRIALIDVNTGARLFEFAAPLGKSAAGGRMIAFSPDGQRIAVGRQGGGESHIAIHSAQDGKELLEWVAPGTDRLEFSPGGNLLLQEESGAKHLNVWDTSTGKLAWTYTPTQDSAWAHGAFIGDGSKILTHGYKDPFRVVNAADGTLIREFKKGPHNGATSTLAIAANGMMASGSNTGLVTLYDLKDGNVLSEFRVVHDRSLNLLAFTPDGEQLVTAVGLPDGRQELSVWQARTGERVRTLLGGSGDIRGAAVHPLTGELVLGGTNTRVWSLTGKPATWDFKPTNSNGLRPVFWGSDEMLFASGNDARYALQKLQPGSPTILWKPPNLTLDRAVVSADGKVAIVWESAGVRRMAVLRNPGPTPEEIRSGNLGIGADFIRLSPSGDRALAHNSTNYELFDTATGEKGVKLDRADLRRFWDFGWLAGGKQLVALTTAKADRGNPGSEERIVLWDAETGKIIQSVPNRTVLGVLAVAPDGKRFAEAGADKMVRIRDAATLAVLREFRAHDGGITSLAWHPGKPILATASIDSTVKLWNLDTGRRLEEFRVPVYFAAGLNFSPSGKRLACYVYGDNTRIWEPQSLNDQPAGTLPADAWEDLLATLTPATVGETGGGWHMEDGALFSPSKKFGKLPLPGNFVGTGYQLRVKLRQLAPKNCFHLQLPVSNRMVGFEMDGFPADGHYTGLVNVSGKYGKDLAGAVHGKVVNDSEQHDLEVTVRLFGATAIITATLDGLTFYEWSGPTAALNDSPSWRSTPGTFSIVTLAADWVVYEVKVKRQQ